MIEINNISYIIEGNQILRDVSLSVQKGEIVTLVGPNGSGKTTLFNVINGFLKPQLGLLIYNNQNINSISAYKRAHLGIGRLWQDIRLFNKMNALENLMISVKNIAGEKIIDNFIRMKLTKNKSDEIREKAEHYLKEIDLFEKRFIEVENLSYGQQKLVALGRLFMNDSKFFLLDEPFAGVNLVLIEKIKNIIENIKNSEKSVLIIEHNILKACEISDRLYAIENGKIILSGDPNDVMNSPILKEAYAGV